MLSLPIVRPRFGSSKNSPQTLGAMPQKARDLLDILLLSVHAQRHL
jgi:hypothetical protein